MKCTHCENIALWQVGKQGFCRAHKAEAYAAEAMKNQQRHRAKVEGETLDKMGHITDIHSPRSSRIDSSC